ncbi:phytoene desaturase family protein [Vibrio sp. WXL210]|uniref:phytoene desaturase family protein n=1 Tax=Vibrio sp. WXL210 TaxID=3450709 RepID=UPI003EC6CD57
MSAPNQPIKGSRAIVIGAGFGGIAAALRLRAKGYSVTLIDKGSQLGGRAKVFRRNGFTFDAGPTVITAPFLIEELFTLFGESASDYVSIVPVAPWYRFHYSDGTCFDYGSTYEDTLAAIKALSPRDVDGYQRLLETSKAIFNVGFTQLADQPFDRPLTMFKQIPNLVRLGCYKSVWQLVCDHLEHEKLRQAFSIQPMLVGGNPFDTTSIYNLIHFLEQKWGVHFALGGMGALVNALEQLMTEQGIDIKLNAEVETVVTEQQSVTGVGLTNGTFISCDVLVSNADPAFLYRKMVKPKDQTLAAKVKSKYAKFSMGLFVLYFGTTKQYDNIAHHTIWLGKRYQSLLDDIFNTKQLADDFSLYVHRPTATDPTMAPEGCDSFYVLSPVPNLQSGIDWEQTKTEYGDKIIKALEESMLPGLSKCIVERFCMTPQDFAQDYNSLHGAGFSIAPTLTQSAYFRFHNRGEGPKNLYVVGAGSHPGAGLPGVLCSAKVLDKLVPTADCAEMSELSLSQATADDQHGVPTLNAGEKYEKPGA